MWFSVLGSGSRGNAILVGSGDDLILIDCGFAYKTLVARLDALGFTPWDVKAIVLSHLHQDHSQALSPLCKRAGPTIYGTTPTLEGTPALKDKGYLCRGIDFDVPVRIGSMELLAVPAVHDTEGSACFSVSSGGHKLALLLETGRITKAMHGLVNGAQAIVIEANYDPEMLADSVRDGEIPRTVGERIVNGHLRNASAGAFLANGPHEASLAVLTHLSAQRNTPELALEAVMESLAEAGRDMEVEVSLQGEPTPLFDLGAYDAH